jgi:anaphase-promoting complex subunit 5
MGDFPTSFDYLHRYFDYSMQSRDRPFYQYALMNLAILQTEFGCHKEAVATMLETVTTARENRDNTCLNFALNWLYQFGRAHPKLVRDLESSSVLGSGKETLSFLRVKAKEAGMWMLWSAALMSEARLGMGNGESVSTAIEHMVRSSQLIIERNLKPSMGGQLAVVTALWDRLGLSYLSGMTDEVFLRCHARNCIFDEQLKATCRLAGLLVGRGMYDEAFTKLESMESNPLRSFKPNQYWQLYRGLLKLRRDLHHQNLEAADHLLSQLIQFGHDSLEPGITHITDELHIEMHIRRGDFTAASTKIDRLLTGLQEDDRDISLRIRLLLDKAHLFDRIGRPAKGFTISMRAASMAWRARLLPLLWQAVGALSNILNSLGEFAAASQLLVAVLPRCLETDNLFVVATLYSLLADAWTGQAGETQPPPSTSLQSPSQTQTQTQIPSLTKRTEFLTKAHEALGSAFNYFSAVEDIEKQCEMLAKKATLMRAMGDYVRSEDYAARYVALKREMMARNS